MDEATSQIDGVLDLADTKSNPGKFLDVIVLTITHWSHCAFINSEYMLNKIENTMTL